MEEIYFDDMFKANSLTVEQLETAIQGQLRVYIAGHIKDMQLTSKELAIYYQAKSQHYLIEEPGKDRLGNIYHQYCVAAKTYWITICLHADAWDNCNLGESHATFWYDFFHFHHGLTPLAFKELKKLFERARPGAYEYAYSKLGEVGGNAIVPEYIVEKLAKALVELFDNPTNHSTEMFDKAYGHIQPN